MKEKLLDILKSPNDKLICVDLDWTLCCWEFWGEWEPEPILDMINYINRLYEKWWHIIIYTARATEYFTITYAWLIKYGVKFHWIRMQHKPGRDLYLDDKALHISDITNLIIL